MIIAIGACEKEQASAGFGAAEESSPTENSTGIAGSMARFAVHGPNKDFLYVVMPHQLKVMDIRNLNNMVEVSTINTGEVETIFPMGEYLLLGTPTGMDIYSLQEPANPMRIGNFQHVRGCDPVVAQDNYAYVTLRGGGQCGGTSNELNVVSISNPEHPGLIKSVPMTEPYGLAADGNVLFVCEGYNGVRVFDISNPRDPKEIGKIRNVSAVDAIATNGLLILTGEEGILQYEYNQEGQVSLLSKFELNS